MLTSPEDFPLISAYVCLKFALEGFSESMVHELEQLNKGYTYRTMGNQNLFRRKLGIRVSSTHSDDAN
jgi:hypothetical protein